MRRFIKEISLMTLVCALMWGVVQVSYYFLGLEAMQTFSVTFWVFVVIIGIISDYIVGKILDD